MSRAYAMLVVEGPSDQAVVEKALQVLGYRRFNGRLDSLDAFWKTEAKVVPTYPPDSGDLYTRLSMPAILSTDARSIAVYSGGGSNLVSRVTALLENHDLDKKLDAFGIVADADKKRPADVATKYRDAFSELFPGFPTAPGSVVAGPPKLGIFMLPDNENAGVVEHLVIECGDAVYPTHMERARRYVDDFGEADRRQATWAPFDQEKALIASVASLLKPGKTNTASIADNLWISEQTRHVPKLAVLLNFLQTLVPP